MESMSNTKTCQTKRKQSLSKEELEEVFDLFSDRVSKEFCDFRGVFKSTPCLSKDKFIEILRVYYE